MEKKKLLKIVFLILTIIVIIAAAYFIVYKMNIDNSVSYVIVSVEDTEARELAYKNKKIIDIQEIEALIEIINNAEPYEPKSFIADLGDIPPTAEVYLSNGKKYTIAAGDEINDEGDIVNLMTKWYTEDGSDKILYKVNVPLAKYIENLYNK